MKCQICELVDFKYKCPKCNLKTCSLQCALSHKSKFQCDGIRNPFDAEINKDSFSNDITFLDNTARIIDIADRELTSTEKASQADQRRDKAFNSACKYRKITLKRMVGLSKNRLNSSFYHSKRRVLFWNLEWIFHDCNGVEIHRLLQKKSNEKLSLLNLLSIAITADQGAHNIERDLIILKDYNIPLLTTFSNDQTEIKTLDNQRKPTTNTDISSSEISNKDFEKLIFLLKKGDSNSNYVKVSGSCLLSQLLYGQLIYEFPSILIYLDINHVPKKYILEEPIEEVVLITELDSKTTDPNDSAMKRQKIK